MANLINTYPIASTSPITPMALYRELQAARARGGRGDYYGLGAALRGVGNDWETMQSDLDKQRLYNAKAEAGYYPAQAARDVSSFNLGAYENTQKLLTQQDLQRAFQETRAEMPPDSVGTAEFQRRLQAKVNTLGGMDARATQRAAAMKEIMNQRVYTAGIKKATEAQIVNSFADAFIKNNADTYRAMGIANKEPLEVTKQRLQQDAQQAAQQHLRDADIKIDFDPTTWSLTVTGIDSNTGDRKEVPLDPMNLAAGARLMGDSTAYNMFSDIATRKFMLENKDKFTIDAKGNLKPITTGKTTPTTTEKILQYRYQEDLKHYNNLERDYAKAADDQKPGIKAQMDIVQARINAAEKQLSGEGGSAGSTEEGPLIAGIRNSAINADRAMQIGGTPNVLTDEQRANLYGTGDYGTDADAAMARGGPPVLMQPNTVPGAGVSLPGPALYGGGAIAAPAIPFSQRARGYGGPNAINILPVSPRMAAYQNQVPPQVPWNESQYGIPYMGQPAVLPWNEADYQIPNLPGSF